MKTLTAKYLYELAKNEEVQRKVIGRYMYKDARELTEAQYLLYRLCNYLFQNRISNHAWG